MSIWYRCAVLFFTLQAMQAPGIVDRLIYGEWMGKGGDKLTKGLNSLMILTSIVLVSRNMRQLRSIRTGACLALGLVALFFLSSLWSIDPAVTIREAIQYLLVVLGTIGIATNLRSEDFMSLLAQVCFFAAVASLILFLVSPGSAIGEEGDFRGIFSQKNVLGEAMTMGALACLHGLRAGSGRRWWNIVMLCTIILVALKSKSATSTLTIFVFFIVSALTVLLQKGGIVRQIAIGTVILCSPLLVLSLFFRDSLLEVIGKDPTLTGRTEIWALVIYYIHERIWLGWGYLAFWSNDNPAALAIGDALHWFAPQAHNGLLEIMLYVGVLGAVFMIFLWIRTVFLSLRCLRTFSRQIAISSLLSCAGVILVGISETVLVDPYEASTSVFFITAFFCERAVRNEREQTRRSLRQPPPIFLRTHESSDL